MPNRPEFTPTNWEVVFIGADDLSWGGIDYRERSSLNACPLDEIQDVLVEHAGDRSPDAPYRVQVVSDDGHRVAFSFARERDAEDFAAALRSAWHAARR